MKTEDLVKQAIDLADSNEDYEVHYHIYCYKDTVVNKYNPPFVNDKEPGFMVESLKNAFIRHDKDAEFTGLELCYLGSFELSKGHAEVFETPKLIVSCDVLKEKFGGVTDGKVC